MEMFRKGRTETEIHTIEKFCDYCGCGVRFLKEECIHVPAKSILRQIFSDFFTLRADEYWYIPCPTCGKNIEYPTDLRGCGT